MRKNEKETARRMQTIAVCGCLCLLAVGAGVTYRAFDKSPEGAVVSTEQTETNQPVTAVQTPTLDTALLERNKQSEDNGETPEAEEKQPAKETKNTEETAAEPVFAYPLQGEVVLPYSIDHAIYDPTLDQYRTNAGISLSAEQGTEVKAAADGTVKEVKEDTEAGNMVIIEHANGWLTTYGQLEDTVPVKEGDRVQQGQTIGSVNAPTKYGIALGSHLEFAMEKDGVPKNPQETLKENG